MILIGIDPGDSTGMVVLHVLGPSELHKVLVMQDTPAVVMKVLRAALRSAEDDAVTIAIERYVDPPGGQFKTAQPTAQQLIGAVTMLAEEFGVPLQLQMPAPAKAIASNAFLRANGLLITAAEVDAPDANDVNMAMRHAVLYLATRHATVFSFLLSRSSKA